MRNGLLAGVLAYLIVALTGLFAVGQQIPVGLLAFGIIVFFVYLSAKNVDLNLPFRQALKEPFRTLVVAVAIYHFAPLVYPGVAGGLTQSYMLYFMMSLIVGFLPVVIVTFVVRKLK